MLFWNHHVLIIFNSADVLVAPYVHFAAYGVIFYFKYISFLTTGLKTMELAGEGSCKSFPKLFKDCFPYRRFVAMATNRKSLLFFLSEKTMLRALNLIFSTFKWTQIVKTITLMSEKSPAPGVT